MSACHKLIRNSIHYHHPQNYNPTHNAKLSDNIHTCTYSTHQVPLLLEQRIRKDAVRSRVAILQSRGRRHTAQVSVKVAQTGKKTCTGSSCTASSSRLWMMHNAAGVVALTTDAFVLLLNPSNL